LLVICGGGVGCGVGLGVGLAVALPEGPALGVAEAPALGLADGRPDGLGVGSAVKLAVGYTWGFAALSALQAGSKASAVAATSNARLEIKGNTHRTVIGR